MAERLIRWTARVLAFLHIPNAGEEAAVTRWRRLVAAWNRVEDAWRNGDDAD